MHNVFILPDYYTDSFFPPHAILRCNSYTWFAQCDSTWFFVHILFLLMWTHEWFLHVTDLFFVILTCDSYTWFAFHVRFLHVIVCFHMWIIYMIHLILHVILAHDSFIFACDSEMLFVHMIRLFSGFTPLLHDFFVYVCFLSHLCSRTWYSYMQMICFHMCIIHMVHSLPQWFIYHVILVTRN